jgi:hypothetical protein
MATVIAPTHRAVTQEQILPPRGQVWVVVEWVKELESGKIVVRIARTETMLEVAAEGLYFQAGGYCLRGLLIEHQYEPGYRFGYRFSGRVVLEQSTFDVPAQSLRP